MLSGTLYFVWDDSVLLPTTPIQKYCKKTKVRDWSWNAEGNFFEILLWPNRVVSSNVYSQ